MLAAPRPRPRPSQARRLPSGLKSRTGPRRRPDSRPEPRSAARAATSYLRRLGASATAPSCRRIAQAPPLRTRTPPYAGPHGFAPRRAPLRMRTGGGGVTARLIGTWETNRCARGGLTHAVHPLPIRIWETVRRVAAPANPLAAARVLFHVANQKGRRGLARGQDGQSPS